MKAKSFRDLIVWEKGHKLVLEIYRITKDFPIEENFGLISQIRRAAVSITSNIAEGFNRKILKDKVYFYYYSLASLAELQNQLLISRDLNYISHHEYQKLERLSQEVGRLLNSLIKSISANF